MANFIFQENQRFRQAWIWVILIGITGISIWRLFFENVPTQADDWEKLIPITLLFLVSTLFFSLRLKTRIDHQKLRFSFFPFIKERSYAFEEIVSMEVIEYNSLLKYGGWGIRYNFESWAYNTGGKYGIMVTTESKKFLIGTHKPKEAQKAIAQFIEFKSQAHGS